MGREASCQCTWAEEAGACKVLLESRELIVRGAIRRRVLVSSLADVTAKGEQLVFRVGQDKVTFHLGAELAQRWAKAIATPPPSLAKKLGISPASQLLLIGQVEDNELKAAIAEAGTTDGKEVDLILACVKTPAELDRALKQCSASARSSVWIIYPKGPGKQLGESAIREQLHSRGFIDTKVASVSATLTALRFARRIS